MVDEAFSKEKVEKLQMTEEKNEKIIIGWESSE